MDLYRLIDELLAEKRRLDELIAYLEGAGESKKRGRKGMSRDERRAVSERMRDYWARRKASPKEAASAAGAGADPSDPVTS